MRGGLFWLCRVAIITEHGQDVQMFIDEQQGQIIINTAVVEGAASQHLTSIHFQSLGVPYPSRPHPTYTLYPFDYLYTSVFPSESLHFTWFPVKLAENRTEILSGF